MNQNVVLDLTNAINSAITKTVSDFFENERQVQAQAIVRVFMNTHKDGFTISDITRSSGVKRGTVYKAIQDLRSEGALTISEVPRSTRGRPKLRYQAAPPLRCRNTETRAKIYAFMLSQRGPVTMEDIARATQIKYIQIKNDVRALRNSKNITMHGEHGNARYSVTV